MFKQACGIGHISNVIKGYNYEVIEQDLYTDYVPHHIDYLASEDPEYSFLITNPPYALKYQFLKKAFESNKPFAMLLPATCFFTVIGSKMFEQNRLVIFAFRRAINFIHNDKPTTFTDMAWFVGNLFPKLDEGIIFTYIDEFEANKEDEDSFSIFHEDVEV